MLPEHPRASTTDNVECFFSVLRDSVGKDFTLQQVKMIHSFVCKPPWTVGFVWLEESNT